MSTFDNHLMRISQPLTISINKEQLAKLPVVTYPGQMTVINTAEEAAEALKDICRCDMTGFDTETKPSFRKGRTNQVSLIQISTGDRCYLFRIKKFGLTPELKAFFENPSVIKVGLSLKDDFHVLHKITPFEPEGFVELQDYVKRFAIADNSLQRIFGIIFGGRISKSQRLSNWEAPTLTVPQQTYASIDAWACLKIYRHLRGGAFRPDESPYILAPAETDDTI